VPVFFRALFPKSQKMQKRTVSLNGKTYKVTKLPIAHGKAANKWATRTGGRYGVAVPPLKYVPTGERGVISRS
tara:strand:+ start:524 stop:742 length:219 start_codon:yes stop_codon:yes gene_type:complete